MLAGRLNRIGAVVMNTFRETVRERVLYNLVFFAILMTVSGFVLNDLTVRQDDKVIKDLGLAAIDVFGTLIAIFIGVGLVNKEIERRSLYPLLARPLTRDEFLVGKFGGLSLTLLVNVGVMTLGLYLTLLATRMRGPLHPGSPDSGLLVAVLCLYVGQLLVVALALFFSVVTSSGLAAICTVSLVLVGRFADVIRNMRDVLPSVPPWATELVYFALPNLAQFDLKNRVVHGESVPPEGLACIVAYGVCYSTVVLSLSAFVFRRKDLQ
jgi:ABC-type transport system involved in multi-copper enzyme maturation permease subunit